MIQFRNELKYAILIVLLDFSEPLNIITDSQYAEGVVLHIETSELIPDVRINLAIYTITGNSQKWGSSHIYNTYQSP